MKKLLGTLVLTLLLLVSSASAQIPWVYPLYPFMETVTFLKDLKIKELSAAPSHSSGYGKMYVLATDGDLYYKDDAGNARNLSTDDPTFGDPTFDDVVVDKIEANECFTFDAVQTATGDGTTLVNWGLGNVMYFTFGSQADTFTFTAPPGVAKLTLVLKQDGTGSRTATWPGTVLWPGNVAPTLSAGAADVDIVSFLWDGTNYFGLFNGNFE